MEKTNKILTEYLEENGILLKCKNGINKTSYTGIYKDVNFEILSYSGKGNNGFYIKFFYKKTLNLGLSLECNVGFMYSPEKDFLSKKINLNRDDLKCWSKDEKIINEMINNSEIYQGIEKLKKALGIPEHDNHFIINDEGVTVYINYFTDNSAIEWGEILESTFNLCMKVESFFDLHSEFQGNNTQGKLYSGFLKVLWILFISFIIFGIIAGIFYIWIKKELL